MVPTIGDVPADQVHHPAPAHHAGEVAAAEVVPGWFDAREDREQSVGLVLSTAHLAHEGPRLA